MNRRIKNITPEEFKLLLEAKKIRGATLQDVEGIHHKKTLYRHPNTKQWFVEV